MISIESEGFERNEEVMLFIKDNIDKHNMDMLHILGDMIVSEARSNLQNNTNINTGNLLSSIMILDEGDDFIIVGTREDYASYIEYGRGPVRPLKEGGWLHWVDKSGKDVFAKFANATEPSPFLEPAIVSISQKFPELYFGETEDMINNA